MRSRRSINGGALAFLDVMACGLGAVVLLFVLIDFNTSKVTTIQNPVALPEVVVTNDDIELIKAEVNELRVKEQTIIKKIANALEQDLKLDIKTTELESEPIKQNTSKVQKNTTGDLIGLKVNGDSIIILLDSSSSMYSEFLDDNLQYSLSPSLSKSKKSTKWNQAKNIAQWLISVAPKSSKIDVVSFNDNFKILATNITNNNFSALNGYLTNLYPSGPTILSNIFEWLSKSDKTMPQVFLITDGLPTKSKEKNIISSLISACKKDPTGFVSGQCRKELMIESSKFIINQPLELNVILLPLEGDPFAAPMFWKLASLKKGILFTPELNWP